MDKHIFIKNIILRGVIITLIGSFISMHGMEEKATKKTDSVAYTNDELVQEVIRRNNGDPKKALMFAVNNNLSGMTRSLLALKVDPNVKDYSDHRIDHVFPSGETEFVTPLISAVHNNNAEMVKILLDTNACVTNDCFNNNSVLTYA
ncbi:MAG: hypothetical protein NTX86_02225 [Candidatus Dependentiae bacterium]|nr:hypothetical protein [Candidatus Dependentiae bacterium]